MFRRLFFYNFYLAYRVDRWVKGRFTAAGAVLLGIAFAAAVFGINTRTTSAFQLFALALSILTLAMLSALTFRCRLTVARQLPRFATAGEPVRYTVNVENTDARATDGLEIAETVDANLPSAGEFAAAPAPGLEKWNWIDRYIGYPRWVSLVQRLRAARSKPAPLPRLSAGARAAVELELTPLDRGRLRLSPLRVTQLDPLGLFKASASVGHSETLLVLPRRYAVSAPALAAAGRKLRGATPQAIAVGGGEEFASLRDYRPGDSTRHIHWKRWARLGTPVVKEFHENWRERHCLVLDTALPAWSSSHAFEEAVCVAASFAVGMPSAHSSLELVLIGTECYRMGTGRGVMACDRLLEALACCRASGDGEFAAFTAAVLENAADSSACLCVLLDWNAERRALVARVRELGLSVSVFVLASPAALADSSLGVMSDQPDRFHILDPGRVDLDLRRSSSPSAAGECGDGVAI